MTAATVRALVESGRGGWVPRGLVGPTSDELRSLCADEQWTFVEVDLAGVEDKKALMRCLAAQLDLPDYFGHNWDALSDCLGDLAPDARGIVLRLKGLWLIPEFLVEPLVDVLDERVDAAAGRGGGAREGGAEDNESATSAGVAPLLVVADPPLPGRR